MGSTTKRSHFLRCWPASWGALKGSTTKRSQILHCWPAIGAGVDKARLRNKAKLCALLQSLGVRDKGEMSKQGQVSLDQTPPWLAAPRAWTTGRPDDRPVSDDPGERARDGEAWFAEAEDAARCLVVRAVCPWPLSPGGRIGTHSQDHDGRGRRRAREFGGERRLAVTEVVGKVLESDSHRCLNLKGEWRIRPGELARWLR